MTKLFVAKALVGLCLLLLVGGCAGDGVNVIVYDPSDRIPDAEYERFPEVREQQPAVVPIDEFKDLCYMNQEYSKWIRPRFDRGHVVSKVCDTGVAAEYAIVVIGYYPIFDQDLVCRPYVRRYQPAHLDRPILKCEQPEMEERSRYHKRWHGHPYRHYNKPWRVPLPSSSETELFREDEAETPPMV